MLQQFMKKINSSIVKQLFGKKCNLKIHVAIVHKDKKIRCDICNGRFEQKADLKTHIATVHCGVFQLWFAEKAYLMKV